MSDKVEVRFLTNLFRGSRMNDVVIPPMGETAEVIESDAVALCAPVHGVKHAERVEVEVPAEPEATPEVASVEAPETAARKPGRPRKVSE